jgi:hypothetical protein
MRKRCSLFVSTLFLAALFAALPHPAAAQNPDQDQGQDPPSRVARLNYIQGSVSYQVSGDRDWVQADQNRPLTTGDNLWADQDSRGEVHIGSNTIRMGSMTGISFLTLDDRTVQLQFAQGTIEVHVRRLAPGEAFEIDTPNVAFTLTRSGEYRLQTDPNGDSTQIVVREGEGEVTGGSETWQLGAGQAYEFTGTDELRTNSYAAPPFDDFEDWCQSRDARENQSPSARYVSRDVDGYYDLDDYGDWRPDAEYGEIWFPRVVAVGWVPYHYGHWVYIAPWGWTWVDDAPWGFAPFHYGRWVLVGSAWGWVPGPVVVRPVYAPALVAFVGGGGFSMSVSLGGGFAGVAWFPLGPRDVYVPGYRCSPRYVQVVNVTNTRVVNVTQVTNVYNTVIVNRNTTVINNYTYARNTTAVTAVSRETFVNARPVSAAAVRVTPDQIERVRTVESAPIAPTRTSYISSNARVATAKPTVPLAQRPVVARLAPAVSRRAPVYTNESREFNRQPSNQPNQNAPLNNDPNEKVQPQNQPRGGYQQQQGQAQGNQQPPSRDGFRPFSPPNNSNNLPSNNGDRGNNPNQQQYQQQQHSRSGFNPPPSGTNNQSSNNGYRGNNANQQPQQNQQQEQRYNQQPNVRFTPPPKARDDMYDVHPPLNQNRNQQQAQPQRQEEHNTPAPKNERENSKDNKKDK